MALGSSANTTKIFGTNVNTVVVDEWTEWCPKKAEPAEPVYLEFNANPLALVCAMLRKGKQAYEAAEVLNGVGKRLTRQIDIIPSIEREDEDRANAILKHFAKKYTMRRIKGEYISKFMLAVEEIVDNPKRINQEYVGILVSLPKIFEQDLVLDKLVKNYKSAPKPNDLAFPPMEGVVEFVDKLHMKNSRSNEYHYYFKTSNNYLLRIVTKADWYGNIAWDTLSKLGKLKISSDMTFVVSIKGMGFNVLQISTEPNHVEITPV